MLRAALIGLPTSGKTTLFQLMTSAKEAPRGKGDVNIGISKVPDARLDILTGMYNPKKRVPATVEFTGLAVIVDAVKKLQPSWVVFRDVRKLALDLEPRRHRVNADTIPRQTRDEDVRPLLVMDDRAKDRWHFKPALVVDPGRSAPS